VLCRGALAGLLILPGCAWNEYGAVQVRRFENDTSYMVQLKSFGLQVVTNSLDRGVHLGWSDRRYIYPKQPLPNEVQLSGPDFVAVRATRQIPDHSPDPLAMQSRSAGVSLNLNAFRTGLTAGVSSCDAIYIPRDADLLMLVDLKGNASQTRLYFQNDKAKEPK